MTRTRAEAPAILAAFAVTAILAAPDRACATVHPLVSGQALSLPLNDASDGPVLKLVVQNAVFHGGDFVRDEKGAERKARADQVVLDGADGKNLVKFLRFAAEDLRGRLVARQVSHPVSVTAVITDKTRIASGSLWGDALKAGFTLGIAAPNTTPLIFASHMEFTVDGRTLTCDAEAPGRVPTTPRKDDPHAHDGADKMAEEARRACWSQVVDKIAPEGTTGAEAAPPTPAPAPSASPVS